MNNKTTSVIITVAIVAIAAIGIGYAYSATTSITDNSAETKYITITPVGDSSGSPFSSQLDDFQMYYNTTSVYEESQVKFIYKLDTSGSSATPQYILKDGQAESNYKIVTQETENSILVYRIGTQEITLATQSNSANVPTHTFEITKTGGTYGDGYRFFVGYNETADAENNILRDLGFANDEGTTNEKVATFTECEGGSPTKTYIIDLYVYFPSTATTEKPSDVIMDDVTFEYKATVNTRS